MMKYCLNFLSLRLNIEATYQRKGLFIFNIHNVVDIFDTQRHVAGIDIGKIELVSLIKQIKKRCMILSVHDLLKPNHDQFKRPKVIFTVDDGYDINYRLLEIFQLHGISVCYFLNGSSFVTDRVILSRLYEQKYGTNQLLRTASNIYRHSMNKKDYESAKKKIDKIIGSLHEDTAVLNYFDNIGHNYDNLTVGYHGRVHERLCFVDDIENAVQFSHKDQKRLFAWPYGKLSDVNSRIFAALEVAKCNLIFSAYGQHNTGNEAIFNRINVSQRSTVNQLLS